MANETTFNEREITNIRANLATDIRNRFSGVRGAALDAIALLDAGIVDRYIIQNACDDVTDELEMSLNC